MFLASTSGSRAGAWTFSTVGLPGAAQPTKAIAAVRAKAAARNARVIPCHSLVVDGNAIVAGAGGLPGKDVDVVVDETNRAVAHHGVDATGMEAASGNHAVGPVVRAAGAARAPRSWKLPVGRGGGAEGGVAGAVH